MLQVHHLNWYVKSRNLITLKKVSLTDMDNLIFNMLSHLKIFCILQVFSSLVVTLLLLITRLSCIYPHQGRHALCLHYLKTELFTLLPGAASSVADGTLRTAASCGHQTRAPGRRLSHWMLGERNMSPGLQPAASAHTSWEVSTARTQLL